MAGTKRKICFVITSYIHYSRSRKLLQLLRDDADIELQIVLGGSAVLAKYGNVVGEMLDAGFDIAAEVTMSFDGGTDIAMAKSTGIGVSEFATVFGNLRPDIVVIRGDRFEVMSPAIAAAYLNIPIAHLEGGDITGNIDESVRHAVSKLAHIHFTTNDHARDRVIRMGEKPEYVFTVGCPGVEMLSEHETELSEDLINYLGVGDIIDVHEPFLVVMHHPVTSEMDKNREHTTTLLEAVRDAGVPAIWFWPNVDAGNDDVSKAIRVMREKGETKNMRFIKYVPTDQFLALLKHTSVLVGNSSAGIKESSYLGVPVVDIGSRQSGRAKGENVMSVGNDKNEIVNAIQAQLEHGPYPHSDLYYRKDCSLQILDTLKYIDLYSQKRFHE